MELDFPGSIVSSLMQFETLTRISGERFSFETTAVSTYSDDAKCLALAFQDSSDC